MELTCQMQQVNMIPFMRDDIYFVVKNYKTTTIILKHVQKP